MNTEGLLCEGKGDVFDQIRVYRDHAECRIKVKKVPITIRKKRSVYISSCPALGIHACGPSEEKAKQNIKNEIERYVDAHCKSKIISLSSEEVGCLNYFNGIPCTDTLCRHWVNWDELDNCVLGCLRGDASTLEKIGDCFGVSREMIRQDEERALRKARKLLKKNTKNNKSFELSDFLPDIPPWIHKTQKRDHRVHGR